jgi:diguanylate cyclase (GGDEF)-like protein
VIVKRTHRGSSAALLLAVLVIAGLVALGDFGDSPTVAVALLAAVPLFAAIFLGPVGTALTALLSLAAAIVLTWLRADGDYSSYVVPLVGVAVASVVAMVSAALRVRGQAADQSASEGTSGEPQDAIDVDPMTGLLNRRGAVRNLGARNAGDERVLAFIDCDLFHQINEERGREIGDEFLQAVAGRLRHALPTRDTVARWDSDEFLVAVSAEPKAAMSALERVVGSMNKHPIRTSAGSIEATVSLGAATWAPGQDLEDVISRAGRALSAAKASGRGQVVLDAGPTGDEPTAS